MSNESEQITKISAHISKNNITKKQKDPKRAAAGKRMAKYNRQAKEALACEIKRDMVKADDQHDNSNKRDQSWSIPYSLQQY